MKDLKMVKSKLKKLCFLIIPIALLGAFHKLVAQGNISTGYYTYLAPGSVNTYWIETSNSLIVIDVQRDLTHAKEALAEIKKIGKPVSSILITHGHPDHYAGVGLFKEEWPGVEIYASKTTGRVMRTDFYGFHKYAREQLGDFPDKVTLPTQLFEDDTTLTLDGVTIITREMGPAESNGATIYYLPSTGDIYFGDLVLNAMHGFYLEEKSAALLAVFNRIEVLFPNAVQGHPGHGQPGPAFEMIARMKAYTLTARKLVADEISKGTSKAALISSVEESLKNIYPAYERPAGQWNMIELSVTGLYNELMQDTYRPVD